MSRELRRRTKGPKRPWHATLPNPIIPTGNANAHSKSEKRNVAYKSKVHINRRISKVD